MSRLLITRPDHDDVTAYLHAWSGKVIEEAKRHGMEIFDLKGERANRRDLESIIRDKQPILVLFNGHGNEKEIAGYNDDTLILLGHNENLLERKIVYSVACSSARELGRKCTESAKCSAFIGYEEDFAFYYDPNKLSRETF